MTINQNPFDEVILTRGAPVEDIEAYALSLKHVTDRGRRIEMVRERFGLVGAEIMERRNDL